MRGIRRRTAAVFAALAAGLTALVSVAGAAPAMARPLVNPVFAADFPDPFVLPVDSGHLAFATQGPGGNVQAAHSADLREWRSLPDAMPVLPRWAARGNTWAPAVLRAPAGFVLYVTVKHAASGRQCISRATSLRPEGPYVDTSSVPLVCQTSMGGSIDPEPFVDTDGSAHLIWKSEGTLDGEPTRIWSQPLSRDGLALIGSPRELLVRDRHWEFPIIEGPSLLLRDGRYYLFYSGNRWETDAYAIGYATCAGVAGPCVKQDPSPSFRSAGAVAGPGGAAVFALPDGATAIAYHAWTAPAVGYRHGGARSLRIERVVFEADGRLTLTRLPVAGGNRYRVATSDGTTLGFGDAAGVVRTPPLTAPIVGMAATASGRGHWLVAADGGVFAFGDAAFFGSTGGLRLVSPVVGMAATSSGGGYWLVAADGGVFAFGDAAFFGSTGGLRLVSPVVGMAATSSGAGYWMTSADGGVFAFGDAPFHGSAGGLVLHSPVTGVEAAPATGGYWLAAADGGIFNYGDARFLGSAVGAQLRGNVVAIDS